MIYSTRKCIVDNKNGTTKVLEFAVCKVLQVIYEIVTIMRDNIVENDQSIP